LQVAGDAAEQIDLGQAAAKAMRNRVALSVMRAAILASAPSEPVGTGRSGHRLSGRVAVPGQNKIAQISGKYLRVEVKWSACGGLSNTTVSLSCDSGGLGALGHNDVKDAAALVLLAGSAGASLAAAQTINEVM
jgi:hypothetical protein